jgi:hypothetical protein
VDAPVHVPGAACTSGHDNGNHCESILFHSSPLPRVSAALSVKNSDGVRCKQNQQQV